jgi:hypothetical protein
MGDFFFFGSTLAQFYTLRCLSKAGQVPQFASAR